jgi:hypothetical protein
LITGRALPSPDAVVIDQDEGKIFLAARRSPTARRTFASLGRRPCVVGRYAVFTLSKSGR